MNRALVLLLLLSPWSCFWEWFLMTRRKPLARPDQKILLPKGASGCLSHSVEAYTSTPGEGIPRLQS